ncbi:MAG: ArsR/SmtB family transcription factor [Promethearchaeota archaeon]
MDLTREKEIKEILCSCNENGCVETYFKELKDYGMKLKMSQKFSQLIEFFNSLGNKDRLMIIKTLKEKGEQCVCELETILDKSQPSISHHLRSLERIGLIRGWKKGKFTYYDLMMDEFENYIKLFKEELDI